MTGDPFTISRLMKVLNIPDEIISSLKIDIIENNKNLKSLIHNSDLMNIAIGYLSKIEIN